MHPEHRNEKTGFRTRIHAAACLGHGKMLDVVMCLAYVHAMAVNVQSYERLEKEVLHLPRLDRSKLAGKILESLDEDDLELSPEWREELRCRVSNIDSGKAVLIPAEDLWKEANQRFGTKF